MNSKETLSTPSSMFEAMAEDGRLAIGRLGLKARAAVLDVGTGKGNFAIFLAQQGFRVTTGEPESDRSQYAKQNWAENAASFGVRDNIKFEAFDAARMPFADGTFDAVFFAGVLHHIDESDREAVLAESLRVAGPAHPIVFLEPNLALLEALDAEASGHPPAANPAEYLGGANIQIEHLKGDIMDIFILKA